MKIAIHPDKTSSESYSEKWAEFLEKRNIHVQWVDLTAFDVFEKIKGCDGVMWRPIHTPKDKQLAKRILYTIEKYLNIPVFPDHDTYWHYDDKIAQYYMMQSLGIPMPKTWIFWDKNTALDWAKTTKYPKIFKLSAGAGSSNVVKISSEEQSLKLRNISFNRGIFPMTMNEYKPRIIQRNWHQLKATLSRIKHGLLYGLTSLYPPLHSVWWQPEKNYIYFQEFIPDNSYDIRITNIGNRAFGFRRFNRPDDFRASGSGKLDFDPAKIELDCVKIAFNISKKLNFQCISYDFLYNENQSVITEISYCLASTIISL
ncbi:hypothetical protein ES705_40931 [subsurface metagenome]